MVRKDDELKKEVGGGFAIKGDMAPLSARPSVNSRLDQAGDKAEYERTHAPEPKVEPSDKPEA